ncbi:MAG: carbon-nitrogen hydrolase family protein [Gammaproteobacteria bacterium]|nr:carbon-nitrogen hydrolase family protein [Gammaproteobacteria bacterium]
MLKLAVVQKAPVFLNKEKSLELAVTCINEAAKKDAKLVVFSECFIPGYPTWIWRLRPGNDWDLSENLHQRLSNNAINMASDDLAPLRQAARQHQLTVVCGIEERDHQHSQSTLYNSIVTIDADGSLLNRHRKLMPTNPEQMVWGMGDASGLKVVESQAGRIGALLCWENYMPLARYALYSQGIEIYIAPTYDSGEGWLGSLQHIAREGGCWVVGCGNLMRGSDIPDDFPEKKRLYPDNDEWVNPGDSVVIAPGGQIVAGPMHQEAGILYCSIDKEKVRTARRTLDVAGHYARPDIFQLQVNDGTSSPCVFTKKTPS